MASVKFLIQGNKNPSTIYLRLSLNRSANFKRKTPFSIDPKKWSKVKGFAISKGTEEKVLNKDLRKLQEYIYDELNSSEIISEEIDSKWLNDRINKYYLKPTEEEKDLYLLYNFLDYFLSEKEKELNKGKIKFQTFKKYKSNINILRNFLNNRSKTIRTKDLNAKLIEEIEDYLFSELNYSINTAGRFVKFIKQIGVYALNNGFKVDNSILLIKGYTESIESIYLNFDELKRISNQKLNENFLDNARDWLIIGCYTGQRVSDLLDFHHSKIVTINDNELLQIKQKKTNKLVSIPIHEEVRKILKKRNGKFPRKISDQKFNIYIKQVCEKCNINKYIRGKLRNPKTGVFEESEYEKYKLVTSHICRRSFATNFYGKIPTSMIIGITAHSTEKQYLEYVGKPQQDNSIQVAEIWKEEEVKRKTKNHLKVI